MRRGAKFVLGGVLAAGIVTASGCVFEATGLGTLTRVVPGSEAPPAAEAPADPAAVGAVSAGAGATARDAAGEVRADPAWVAATAGATGIPERALSAYAEAAFAAGEEFPSCGIGWNTLAGIGHAETSHGSYAGASLDADGVVRPTVLGPPLDGTSYDAVPDTDGGALDGDTLWERAVGPMQFLPETWAHYGAGIGTGNINSIDDAAHATARMLCDVGGDLSVPENWIRAVGAYNPNVAYNNEVAEWADRYAGEAN